MESVIPEAALNQHIAILGKTGSGKTYAAKGIVEHLLGMMRQVCVVDPTGAWWGLRLDADGKRKGFNVVLLGGKHADIPLAECSGAAVARLVTQQRASVVIDTSGLTVGEYTRWFTDFAGTLYTTIREPLHLVIDEAHCFMPQGKVPDPQAGKMLHAGNRLMSGGRSLGIRATLITQRPAKLHKDSLTCADTLIAMRVMGPQDRGAIEDWIDGCGDPKQGKTVVDSLAQLQRGDGWVWYPEGEHLKRVHFPGIQTYDSSATPKHGAGSGPSVTEIDLGEVKSALAEAVAEAEANDPKLLRAKIAELQRAASNKAPVTDDKAVERAVAARDREWKSKVKAIEQAAHGYVGRLRRIGELAHLNGEAKVPTVEAPARIVTIKSVVPVVPRSAAPTGMRSGGKARILAALAQNPDGLSDRAIGILAGLSSRSGTFSTYLAACRSGGLIEGDRGRLKLTKAGIAETAHVEPLPSGLALQEHWRNELGGGGLGRMFAALCDAYPGGRSREELGEAAGLSAASGTFSTYLAKLRTLNLVTGSTELFAAKELFDD